uniref:Calreticulin-like n=1 Tax=Stegastes partitus TaxID=144197 RepID=A0A3B5AJK2_9TELE
CTAQGLHCGLLRESRAEMGKMQVLGVVAVVLALYCVHAKVYFREEFLDGGNHLYTLILNPDQTYEVKIDNEKVESGSLEDDWDFLPPKKIKDPEIDDADDTKPEVSKLCVDWDKPENIPDPDAKKPEDWDEDMDGEWEPPMIPNPDYKIDNPEYSADSNIYKFDNIGVLGLDLWQVKSGTIFDNFLITDDVKEAEDIAQETWGVTKEQDDLKRKEEEEKNKEQDTEADEEEDLDEEEDEDEEEGEEEIKDFEEAISEMDNKEAKPDHTEL